VPINCYDLAEEMCVARLEIDIRREHCHLDLIWPNGDMTTVNAVGKLSLGFSEEQILGISRTRNIITARD
jgi:hypothetical protein